VDKTAQHTTLKFWNPRLSFLKFQIRRSALRAFANIFANGKCKGFVNDRTPPKASRFPCGFPAPRRSLDCKESEARGECYCTSLIDVRRADFDQFAAAAASAAAAATVTIVMMMMMMTTTQCDDRQQ